MRPVGKLELSRWFAGMVLRESEEEPADADARVRRAIDTLPVTMFEFDPNGTYTAAAGGYMHYFGITSAQILGRSIFDFPKFVPGKNMMVRRALAGEAVSFSGIWPRGRFMIRLEPRLDAQGRVEAVVGLGYEVSRPVANDEQLEQLLEALRQSELRFRAMCESAPAGIFLTNPRLELSYVNPALCGLLDRRLDALIGQHWQLLLHPTERTPAPDPAAIAAVLRLQRNDGSPIWTSLRIAEMREDAEVLGFVGVVVDITQERAARLAQERAQQDLRSVIEGSPEGIAVVREGVWIFVNRALAEALGYARTDALIGSDTSEIIHPEDRLLAQELDHCRDDQAVEVRCRRADGEYALMEIRPAALREFEDAPAILYAARDITERRKLEAQSLVTERLLSMGALAAGVAHEINNPLAALLSQLEWLSGRLQELSGPQLSAAALQTELQRLSRPVSEARHAGERVRTIVRDLKLFSRAEDEVQGLVDLSDVLDSVVRMAWNELRHRARFVRDYGELPLVEGSEARLGQVFLNLLINAAHAVPEGRAHEHEIRLSAHAVGAQIVVEVADTGVGIPEPIRGKIFDPFFTTKPHGMGSGLGLSICQRIVTMMGGQIEVESEHGRGSLFRVTLACARPSQRLREPTFLPQDDEPQHAIHGRVLVIDDDPAMANALELVLSDQHEVDVFTNARRALARLQDGVHYDAIVCDVMMPEMTGMDFHDELARTQPQLAAQIIFLTGGAFTPGAREFLDRVENPRLDKPFDAHSLRFLVRQRVAAGRGDT